MASSTPADLLRAHLAFPLASAIKCWFAWIVNLEHWTSCQGAEIAAAGVEFGLPIKTVWRRAPARLRAQSRSLVWLRLLGWQVS
jgi:hypothetical protein